MNIDPTHLNAQQLGELGADAVDHLARRACGTLTSYRLLLGRCLLAMDRHRYHFDHGCCTSIHYACVVLGLKAKQARQFRHVATRLEELPALSNQAVQGLIAWCKLREVIRVASLETEEFWIDLCHHKTYEQIERLVALTAPGQLPALPEGRLTGPVHTELRIQLSPQAMAVVDRGLQALSQQAGRVLNRAEAVEMVFAQLLAGHPLDEDLQHVQRERALAKARSEARKDLEECPVRDTRFHPEARHTTPAQTRELQRRDGYRCSTSSTTRTGARPCHSTFSRSAARATAMFMKAGSRLRERWETSCSRTSRGAIYNRIGGCMWLIGWICGLVGRGESLIAIGGDWPRSYALH